MKIRGRLSGVATVHLSACTGPSPFQVAPGQERRHVFALLIRRGSAAFVSSDTDPQTCGGATPGESAASPGPGMRGETAAEALSAGPRERLGPRYEPRVTVLTKTVREDPVAARLVERCGLGEHDLHGIHAAMAADPYLMEEIDLALRRLRRRGRVVYNHPPASLSDRVLVR